MVNISQELQVYRTRKKKKKKYKIYLSPSK